MAQPSKTVGRVARFVCVVLVLLMQASSSALGTLTVTMTTLSDVRVIKYSLAWASDEDGAVSDHIATLAVVKLGYLQQIKFIPDGGGTAPTTLYDVTLVDENGVDFLSASGANLSATVSTLVRPSAPLLYDGTGTLDLVVANAGISKGGTVQLWIAPQ